MYYLLGWDQNNTIYVIRKSIRYPEVKGELESGKYQTGKHPNNWRDLVIVTDIFKPDVEG